MNVNIKTTLLLLTIFTTIFAFERVPKQYSLALGSVYGHKNEVSGEKMPGATVMFDYSWQLSGLDGSRASSFITVPIGYTYFKSNPQISILSYGWTIRHNLLKKKPIIPFLGYGLLLNQLKDERDKGKRFGHQTRFDAGCEWLLDKPLHLFTKVEWSMTRFPERTSEESDWLYTVALKVGVRLCKKARSKEAKSGKVD